MPYPWDEMLNGGPGARQPAPPGVATAPIGRPPVGVIQPDPLPAPGTPMMLQSQQSGAPRPALSPYSRPPRMGAANDLATRPRFGGPPVREGWGPKGTRSTPPGYLGPPVRDDRSTPPGYLGPPLGDDTREGGPIRPPIGITDSGVKQPPRMPPEEMPAPKTRLPRGPGNNDFPPRETSAMDFEAARRRFGRWPGMADPLAPPPPVQPGGMNFNPFTGEWS